METRRNLFQLPILAEPDCQRLPVLLHDCIRALGASPFPVSARTVELMARIRSRKRTASEPVVVHVRLCGSRLFLHCGEMEEFLCSIPRIPDAATLTMICESLAGRITATSPELLRVQNERIREQLEIARLEADQEVAVIEEKLARRKKELATYMKKAETDSLTGLLNRGAYDRHLERSVRLSNASGLALTLVFLDLDHFKAINDSLGHAHGDEVLKTMAGIMQDVIRESEDLPCRVGGDEFAILLQADLSVAIRASQKILEQVPGSVSIGIAPFCPDDTPAQLAHRADEALYLAKHRGRGQIAVHPDAVQPILPAF